MKIPKPVKLIVVMSDGEQVPIGIESFECELRFGVDDNDHFSYLSSEPNGRQEMTIKCSTHPGMPLDGIKNAFGYRFRDRK